MDGIASKKKLKERGRMGKERERERKRKEGRAYFEMVILVPDSAMILLRVLPPFPAERERTKQFNYT